MAFRLPLAQHGLVGCPTLAQWAVSLGFQARTEASGIKDFQTVRQEKTLALAYALQTCAERSGMLTRVLCDSAGELQRCMAPVMSLSGDEIVEASLLGPNVMNTEPLLLQRRKLPSWVRNLSHQRPPRPHLSQNAWRSLNPQNPQSRLMLSLQSPPSKLMLLVLPFSILCTPILPRGKDTLERDWNQLKPYR